MCGCCHQSPVCQCLEDQGLVQRSPVVSCPCFCPQLGAGCPPRERAVAEGQPSSPCVSHGFTRCLLLRAHPGSGGSKFSKVSYLGLCRHARGTGPFSHVRVCGPWRPRSAACSVGIDNSPRLTGENALGALSSREGTKLSHLRELDAVAKPQG